MSLKSALLMSTAAAAVLSVSPAQAGAYISVFGGWTRTSDVAGLAGKGTATYTATRTHGVTPHTDTVTFSFGTTFKNSGAKGEGGYILGAAIGADLSNLMKGLRGEFEMAFRRAKLGRASQIAKVTDHTDTVSFGAGHTGGAANFVGNLTSTTTVASGSGSVRTFTLMANAWYDFDLGAELKPYVGGGVGYASNKVSNGLVMDGSDGGFAWQLGAGLNYRVGDKTSIGLGYRYLDADSVELVFPKRLGGPISRTNYDITNHAVLLNLTFDIGK